jgi:hypothetical protein
VVFSQGPLHELDFRQGLLGKSWIYCFVIHDRRL